MDAILHAQGKVLASSARTDLPFMPVVDGAVLPVRPIDAVRDGLGAVPTMIGTTKDEMTLFTVLDLGIGEIDGDAVNRALARTFGERGTEVRATYETLYPDATSPTSSRSSPPIACSASPPSAWPRRASSTGRPTCICSRGRRRSSAGS